MSDPTMPMPDDPDMPGRTVEDPPMPEDLPDNDGLMDDDEVASGGGLPKPTPGRGCGVGTRGIPRVPIHVSCCGSS
jgi:hypothetical protein